MTGTTRLTTNSGNLTASVIDGEVVLVNLSNGVYYSLLGVGYDAWLLLGHGLTITETGALLAARYGADAAAVEQDVRDLAEAILAEGVMTVDSLGGAPSALPELPPVSAAYRPPVLEIYRDMQELLALDPPMPGLRDIPWNAGKADSKSA